MAGKIRNAIEQRRSFRCKFLRAKRVLKSGTRK